MATSIERALDVIELIAAERQGISDLSARLGVHRSTVLRLLQTLEARGYARRSLNGKWGIGFGLVAIGQGELDRLDLREVAHQHLVALSNELGHTVHLASLVGHDIVYIDKVDGGSTIKLQSRVGGRALVHTAGVAKAALAFASDAVRAAAIDACTFERFTPTTIASAGALIAELDRIRERGWARDNAEAESFINCVALPIFGTDGRVIGGMSVTAVKALAPLPVLEGHLERIRLTRDAICAELGYSGVGVEQEQAS
ncbi:MAG: IclR family transcriptional regulator [Salinibacterium amurskyense]